MNDVDKTYEELRAQAVKVPDLFFKFYPLNSFESSLDKFPFIRKTEECVETYTKILERLKKYSKIKDYTIERANNGDIKIEIYRKQCKLLNTCCCCKCYIKESCKRKQKKAHGICNDYMEIGK